MKNNIILCTMSKNVKLNFRILLYVMIVYVTLLACNTLEKVVDPLNGDDTTEFSELIVTKITATKVNPDGTTREIEIGASQNNITDISLKPVWKLTFSQKISDNLARTKGRVSLYKASEPDRTIELNVEPMPEDVNSLQVSLKSGNNELSEGTKYFVQIEKGLKIVVDGKNYIINNTRKIDFTTKPNDDSTLKLTYNNSVITPVGKIFTIPISTTESQSAIRLTLNINVNSSINSCTTTATENCSNSELQSGSCNESIACDTHSPNCTVTYHKIAQGSPTQKCIIMMNCQQNLSHINGLIEGQNFDFSNNRQRTFVVTSQNGCASHYVVKVNVRSSVKQITKFTLKRRDNASLSSDIEGTIKEELKTITMTVPRQATITNLIPEIEITDTASISPASATAQDFTNIFTYSVAAEDDSTIEYKVTINVIQQSSEKSIISLNFDKDINTEAGIKEGDDITVSIIDTNINVIVPLGIDLSKLKPTIEISEKSTISPASQALKDFSNSATTPVTYTVTAEDESTRVYQITITEKDPIVVIYANEGILLGNTERTIPKSTLMTEPSISRVGYILAGWYTDSELTNQFQFATPITTNLSLYAKWNKEITTWKITYDTDGGGSQAPSNVDKGSSISAPTQLVKQGYVFDKWYTEKIGGVEVTFPYTPTSDVTIYARWMAKNNNITFHLNGGSPGGNPPIVLTTAPYTPVISNQMVTKPNPDPVKIGYTFDAWYTSNTGGVKFDFNMPIFDHQNLYAKWTPDEYTISFDTEGGFVLVNIQTQMVLFNGLVTKPSQTPTKRGYSFQGWNTKDTSTATPTYTEYDFSNTPVTSDFTLFALWKKITHTISFDLQKGTVTGSVPIANQNIDDGRTITKPTATISRTGYKFKHWSKTINGNSEYMFNTPVNTAFTLYAVWTPITSTVKFKEGIVDFATINDVPYNTLIMKPTNEPTNTDQFFIGWFTQATGGVKFDFLTTKVTQDLELYAQWKNKYRALFHDINGEIFANDDLGEQLLIEGDFVKKPRDEDIPEETGYDFVGWYTEQTGGQKFGFDFVRVSDSTTIDRPSPDGSIIHNVINIYARYIKKTLTVTYWYLNSRSTIGNELLFQNPDGSIPKKKFLYGDSITVPTNVVSPLDDGRVFRYWFLNGDRSETQIDLNTFKVQADIVLKAKYQ